MIIFLIILFGFSIAFALLVVLMTVAFEDTETFKAIDEWIAERMVKHDDSE